MAKPFLASISLVSKLATSQINMPWQGTDLMSVVLTFFWTLETSSLTALQNYGPANYVQEFGHLIDVMNEGTSNANTSSALARASQLLIGPNIISGYWTPEMVWNTGFAGMFPNNLAALAVEQYAPSLFIYVPMSDDKNNNYLATRQITALPAPARAPTRAPKPCSRHTLTIPPPSPSWIHIATLCKLHRMPASLS
jgi:hypothetical protein